MLRVHGEAEARPVTRSKQAQAGTALVTASRNSRGKRASPDGCCRCARPSTIFRKQVRGGGTAVGLARTERGLRSSRLRTHRVCAQIRGGVGRIGRQAQHSKVAKRLRWLPATISRHDRARVLRVIATAPAFRPRAPRSRRAASRQRSLRPRRFASASIARAVAASRSAFVLGR